MLEKRILRRTTLYVTVLAGALLPAASVMPLTVKVFVPTELVLMLAPLATVPEHGVTTPEPESLHV